MTKIPGRLAWPPNQPEETATGNPRSRPCTGSNGRGGSGLTCPRPPRTSPRWVYSSRHVVLTRPAAPALPRNDLAADEQFSSPDTPRLPALHGAGQARGPDRAVAAQRLRKLNIVG